MVIIGGSVMAAEFAYIFGNWERGDGIEPECIFKKY